MAEGKGKGFDYYRGTYTHEQLWDMLVSQGDSWSVEQAGSVWTTATGGLESARDQLDTSMLSLVDYWTGPASEEFQRRMRLVYEYSEGAEEDMKHVGQVMVPGIAQQLSDAQQAAQDQNLDPSQELTFDDWLEEVKNVQPNDPDYLEKQEQYKTEYEQYQTDRHDAMAQIVADLGDKYAATKEDPRFKDKPSPPPSDMPGNEDFQAPTGGVFGQDGLSTAGSTPAPPTDANSADHVVADDDTEPVDGWNPDSYDNLDGNAVGGLASGGVAPVGGSTVAAGGVSTGGTSLAGAGAGLFGPAAGAASSSSGGRGAGSSPARSGASTSKPGSTSPGRSGARSLGKTGTTNPRGGTRSGYADDDDEEEYSHETWLKEDDVDWRRDRTPDEELDDD